MKKRVIVFLFLTTLVLAKDHHFDRHHDYFYKNPILSLSTTQQEEYIKLESEFEKNLTTLKLSIETKEFEIKKELISSTPNLILVDSLTKEKYILENQKDLLIVKYITNIKEKFGIIMNDFDF